MYYIYKYIPYTNDAACELRDYNMRDDYNIYLSVIGRSLLNDHYCRDFAPLDT